MNKNKHFELELSFIKNSTILEFAKKAINELPDYFFIVAASSTGKYHPNYALGEGGLVRHTQAAVRIAIQLFKNNSVQSFTDDEKDIIIVALILHDGFKHGLVENKYTKAEHPKIMAEWLSTYEHLDLLEEKIQEKLIKSIHSHMGEWNTDYQTKKEILPKPKSALSMFVHMCDYLASRKCIEINFEAEI